MTTEYQITCPHCGESVIYNYKSKDAFGRITCPGCGGCFSPSKAIQPPVPIKKKPMVLPKGAPRPLAEDYSDSVLLASLANTPMEYSVKRKSVHELVETLGWNQMQIYIQTGLDYLNANRIAAALACFYEAELIKFDDEQLEKIRARFNRPGQSFNSIAEEYFRNS